MSSSKLHRSSELSDQTRIDVAHPCNVPLCILHSRTKHLSSCNRLRTVWWNSVSFALLLQIEVYTDGTIMRLSATEVFLACDFLSFCRVCLKNEATFMTTSVQTLKLNTFWVFQQNRMKSYLEIQISTGNPHRATKHACMYSCDLLNEVLYIGTPNQH